MATAKFPSSVVTWTDKVNEVDKCFADHINQLYAEIIALETGLINKTFMEVKAASTDGYLDKTATTPTAITRMNYNGYLYATKLFNAIYNDYAEYFEKGEINIEPGDIIELNTSGDGYVKSTKYASKLVRGVCSDTFGHCVGGDGKEDVEKRYAPIGLAGRVKVKILGRCIKGQFVIASNIPGVGIAIDDYIPGAVLGQVEESKDTDEIGRVRMFIMRI